MKALGTPAQEVHDAPHRQGAQSYIAISSSASIFGDHLRAWVKFAPAQILVLIVVWGVLLLRGLSPLPVQPIQSPNLPLYLQASEIRPHGYSLFLEAYRFVVGDLSYLPQTQWLLLATSSLLLSLAVGWRVNNVLAAGLIVACCMYLGFRPYTDYGYVMSDPLYETLLVSAAASLVWYFSGADALFLTGSVHASYLATARVEGGFERYTAPTWPLMIAAIILVMHISAQNWPGSARVRTHQP